MRANLKWWIKERHNPQLGVYYVLMGQMSAKDAKKHEEPLYGDNVMRPYDTEELYKSAIATLRKRKQKVQ